jgi:hypothetical protein
LGKTAALQVQEIGCVSQMTHPFFVQDHCPDTMPKYGKTIVTLQGWSIGFLGAKGARHLERFELPLVPGESNFEAVQQAMKTTQSRWKIPSGMKWQ